MLVLNRKIDERVIIGSEENTIEISVISVKGNQVKLGITAAKHIPVHREEIHRLIVSQKHALDESL